ncbi:MAG: 5-oxoprolinase subunit PxpA [Winogradskyella sp.]|uniref:5-oxoprolinase subunit PxpA n=1 Tax=Winogradskyella sp. TaxID=1883156 RepID=UPI0017B842AF|nr:5-oxoprolinase subunit PxpA [Winogradskyella sp.]
MTNYIIDINADVGEGVGNEADLMPYLSSCNIACGGHAGDVNTMVNVVKLAKSNRVKIGAHPSFPDRENFGRVDMNLTAAELYTSLKQQIRTLQRVLYDANCQLHHIKPHGALYNLASKDAKIASVIIEVIKSIAIPIKLYAPYNSKISKLATRENIEVTFEAFADRNYNDDLSLVSRQFNNALLGDKDEIFSHLTRIITQEKVRSVNGVKVPIKASTFCVHSDTKNVTEILKFLSVELPRNNISIQ